MIERAGFGQPFCVFTPGATVAARARKNRQLHRLLAKADLLLPDGVGVTLCARLSGEGRFARCPGIETAEKLLPLAEARHHRLFLYGGREEVVSLAATRIRTDHPGLSVGFHHGYDPPPLEKMVAFRPDVLFVCLGFPRQEMFMERYRDLLPCLSLGLGGSLDVWAQRLRRAPSVFRTLGLEWLWRIAKEPRRAVRLFPVPALLGSALCEGAKKCLHIPQKNENKRKYHRDL